MIPPGPVRVLIAEDDLELRKWLRLVFRPMTNLEITEAVDGADLQARLARGPPYDVIITDIRMPGRSGLEVVIEARQLGVRTPVIFLTGFGDAAVVEAVGMLDRAVLLRKPVDNLDLVAHLERFLAGKAGQSEGQ